ncbi:N-acetylmuramoyl-L-alanine amidase [Streptomyces sp. NRRL B-1677]|uniref:N-acetylmuramoyl-L-alanine amidase n=1 Tax=Streptomyces klenkii TaxID=1420899 RepID=A0A3B0BQD9_9ACTN|nr:MULTISPECIES: N-acetylmuramoyl-L-alanine amidase [Streptomyces]MBF6048264.1 N-acetylmuramoyl-L-alanine amidase [Streptomyces sp. NRRL B-1677]RKN75535.1 N-acetylmuramoyl-L-alanine amidase [Streptomyces klenkii]
MSKGSFPRFPRSPRAGRPARRPARFRTPVVVTVAALIPAGVAGWLLWDAEADGGKKAPVAAASSASSASSAAPGRSPASQAPSQLSSPEGKAPSASGSPGAPDPSPAAADDGPLPDGPLKGKVVVVDPGHNIRNSEHTAEIDRSVDIGTGRKECDTTGTSTDDGYAEASFSLDVAHRLRTILRSQGAKVVFTHDGERPYGPCVDERAAIGNRAHADAAVSVHADGSAVGNRGFHVILPAAVKGGRADTSPIVGPSKELGVRIAGHFVRVTRSAASNYIGGGTGLDTRGDLGGLNLSTVPKVFIECGNMRDPQDAALLTDGAWRQKAAQGIADGITDFLDG